MSDFRIAFFDEIDDPYKVTLVFQLSLSWPATPKLLQDLRSSDDRYTREFGIFAVMRDGTVASGLLLMKIPTRTIEGRLEVGGINAVGTRPDFARRGLMTAITDRAHEYFLERGLEHSVLTTSKRLGAMTMYQQLGYAEIDHSRVAVKFPNQPPAPMPSNVLARPFSKTDLDNVDAVYKQAVEGSTGFVYRPKNFLKARNHTKGHEIKPAENMRIAEHRHSVTGYAYWESNTGVSEATEIMVLDEASFDGLLADAESRNPEGAMVIHCDGITNLEIGWLRRAGYQDPLESYGSLLVKSLKQKTDPDRIKRMYAVESGRFRIGLWDGT